MEAMDAEPVSFLGRPLGPSFRSRIISIPPEAARAYDESEWRDALVVVECGQVALECRAGGRRIFGQGQVLWLTGMGVVTLHNEDATETVVLVAVSRRDAPDR